MRSRTLYDQRYENAWERCSSPASAPVVGAEVLPAAPPSITTPHRHRPARRSSRSRIRRPAPSTFSQLTRKRAPQHRWHRPFGQRIAGDPLPEGPMPSAVAIDPQKRFLYVTTSSGEIRGYSIDPSSLNLTSIAGSPFATSAQSVAIAVDPSGQFVLTANGSTNTVSVFKI